MEMTIENSRLVFIENHKQKDLKKIEDNTQELKEPYQKAYNQACNDYSQAGMMKMYSCFNSLVPHNFRDGLSFPESMVFNSWIISQLANLVK
jgi:hypothetical protein